MCWINTEGKLKGGQTHRNSTQNILEKKRQRIGQSGKGDRKKERR